MGMTIDDNVKTKLLDSLAKEPAMVISTAYAYAKNYTLYGEDITKAWTTAVQQASIIQQVRIKAEVEAYDRFKADYENRLKADKVAMLKELQSEIEEIVKEETSIDWKWVKGLHYSEKIIQKKIDALESEA